MVHITKTKTKGRSSQKSTKNKLSYAKYANALSYLVSETPLGEISSKFSKLPKSLTRPNKKSVENIKKQYKKARSELVKIGFELPTVTQLSSAWEANLEYENSITSIQNEEPKLTADDISGGDSSYWDMLQAEYANADSEAEYNADMEMVEEIKASLERFATDCEQACPYIYGRASEGYWYFRCEKVISYLDNIISLGKEHIFIQKWYASSVSDIIDSAIFTPSSVEAAWNSIEEFMLDFLDNAF